TLGPGSRSGRPSWQKRARFSCATTGRDSTWHTPGSSSAPSSGSTIRGNSREPGSAWPTSSESSSVTAVSSGRKAKWKRERRSFSRWRPEYFDSQVLYRLPPATGPKPLRLSTVEAVMQDHRILLVEDDPNDEELTIRALKMTHLQTEVVVARNGVQALDYLFATGAHAGRDVSSAPAVTLLDLKLPKVDGHEVLRRIRADKRT